MNCSDNPLSSGSTTSTIRSRNRRPISLNDKGDSDITGRNGPASLLSSFPCSPPRDVSPIPQPHPSRRQDPRGTGRRNINWIKEDGRNNNLVKNTVSTASTGLWESWSALQELASTLLGSDTQGSKSPANESFGGGHRGKTSLAPRSAPEWGPGVDTLPQPGTGSQEERLAMVQAKKREALLLADAHMRTDTSGRHKRRDSDANMPSLVSTDHTEDALVYVHKVKPSDTLAGVLIKYGCQPEVFRKVNRLWPNDNIQIRTHVFLPVDACSIRGQKIDSDINEIDLLSSNSEKTQTSQPGPSTSLLSRFDAHTSSDPLSLSLALTSSPDASTFKHESWVQIATHPSPVEILRIPSRTLGFFPPPRRKSTSSDKLQLNNLVLNANKNSTPKSSLDNLRHPPTHAAMSSMNSPSPSRRRPSLSTRLHRSSSGSSSAHQPRQATFAERLRGPGGVGTLRPTNASGPSLPGPAEDPLNKIFAHHLPNMAPPDLTPRATPRITPRVSTDSTRSNSSTGLGELVGGVEGWVRKLGGRKSGKVNGRVARERMGDLIELDGGEGGGEDELAWPRESWAEDEESWRMPATAGISIPATGTRTGMSATDEALLRERFPPRGRTIEAYTRNGKGKAD